MPVRRSFFASALLAASALLLAACHGSSSSTANPAVTVTVTPSSGANGGLGSASPAPTSGGEPGLVAVTTSGALEALNSNGSVASTLVPSGVLGGEVSVSPNGSTVYFTEGAGCHSEVESVSISGGDLTAIAPGQIPAISPDGTKLAYSTEPLFTDTCVPDPAKASVAAQYKIVVRTLATGAEQVIGLPAQVERSQLLPPVGYLSWASNGSALAVSSLPVADNEGWNLSVLDLATAKYYAGTAAGITNIPVTGSPTPQRSYIREGIFLPDGNFFISRACCGGVPIKNTSRLLQEVNVNGELVHQVAIGYPSLDHYSLASDSTGQWLLYIGGNDLYVSQDGNRPADIASGVIAAAWT
jgi:hypothetical protein